jgi:hypothetical protein
MGLAMEFNLVKIEVFIPEDFVTALQEEISSTDAGRIGNYDHCCSVTQVRGYWRPLEGANPFDGQVGRISEGQECKVEVNCLRKAAHEVIKAIRKIHPYEEPLINIIPLMNDQY